MQHQSYIVTFEDGSEAYLAHYGVKGMKWGVWNAETRAKYSGGDSSWKGAKKTAKDLNALDKRRAVEVGKMNEARKKAIRTSDKATKQAKRGKSDKAYENIAKSDSYLKTAHKHENAIKGIEKQQKTLSRKLVSEGYTVKTRNVSRSTLTAGEKALRTGLFAAAAISPAPVAVYVDSRTKGTKYSVKKPKQ